MSSDASFAHLLNSNVAPDPVESASVQLSVNDLASEISRLKLRLADLEDQHRKFRTILSPVRRVPPETLGDIFALVMPPSLILSRDGRDRLLQLCLVCRAWRRAALLASPLWAGVEVTPEDAYAYDKTVDWLERSGGFPRTFVFREAPHLHGTTRCHCTVTRCMLNNPLLSRLLCEGPVIEEMRLRCTTVCFKRWSVSLQRSTSRPRPWDGLQSLYLDVATMEWNGLDDTESQAEDSSFSHLPVVSRLTLVLPLYSLFLPDFRRRHAAILIPHHILEQLTALELHCDWDGPHIYTMLERCTNIESLTLLCGYYGKERFVFPSPLRLPKVRTLRIQQLAHSTSAHSTSILSHLVTPALTDLHLEDFRFMFLDNGENFCSMLTQFLRNSNVEQKLQGLRLDDAVIADELLMALLVDLPCLEHLTLRHAIPPRNLDNRGDLWKMLHEAAEVGGGHDRYLPALTTVELLRVRENYNFQHLLDWIHARPADLPPCHVVASYIPPPNEAAVTWQMLSEVRFDVVHDWQGQRAVH